MRAALADDDQEPPPPAAPAVVLARAETAPPAAAVDVERLRRMFAAREIAKSGGMHELAVSLEAVADDAPLPSTDDILDRVHDVMSRIPPDEIGDPAEFSRALEAVLRHGKSGVDKLQTHVPGETSYSADEAYAMEAVIVADGTRPSFLLRKGAAPTDHPLAGQWGNTLIAQELAIAGIAQAVGRIQPVGGGAGNFFGTGSLVDAAKGLVLTNRHVVEQMVRRATVLAAKKSDTEIQILAGAVIDFVGETQTLETNLFKIVSARLSSLNGPDLERLDAAVLAIEPIGGARMPAAVTVRADLDAAQGAANSALCRRLPGAARSHQRQDRRDRLGLGQRGTVRAPLRAQASGARAGTPAARLRGQGRTQMGVRPRRHDARRVVGLGSLCVARPGRPGIRLAFRRRQFEIEFRPRGRAMRR